MLNLIEIVGVTKSLIRVICGSHREILKIRLSQFRLGLRYCASG